jgi:hypothetical protein
LVWVGHVAGKRENRRLIGDYVLTENDIRRQTLFPDRVAYGGWCLDDHHSGGFLHQGSFGVHYDRPGGLDACMGSPFSIPYRSLYSKNVANLLMAGRDISATHMALSDTRVMLTCAVIGQAAGTAGALCVRHQTSPRGVYQQHLDELQQQLLKDGAYIIGLPNRDPRDLARSAAIAASSELTRADGELLAAANVINGFARAEGGKPNAWSPRSDGPKPDWLQLAWDQPQRFNVVHVTFATKSLVPDAFRIEAWQDGVWRTVAEQSRVQHRRYVLGLEPITTSKLRLAFMGLASVCEVRVYDEPQRVVEIARRVAVNREVPDASPGLVWMYDVDPRKLPGLVLDASQAQQIGSWMPSTYARPYVLDGYVHDGDTGKGEKSVRFVPDIPRAGKYEIRLAYVSNPNRATNTPVTISTPNGSTTVRVDQRTPPEIDRLFHSLGIFDLPAGKQSTIAVDNAETDGYVVVDAVQLLPQ